VERFMPIKGKILHPALKHAGYCAMGVLPGENKGEFEKLHRDLIDEFKPNGAYENDIVATMAHLLWRKQNLETFRIAERARQRSKQIRDETVPEDRVEYAAMPLLGVVVHEPVDPAVREAAIRAANERAHKELGETYELVEIGEIATIDSLTKDLEIHDRLDATIDKCIKRLLMVRGLKSISSESFSAPPKRLARPSRAA
jgi:hypothetical protein